MKLDVVIGSLKLMTRAIPGVLRLIASDLVSVYVNDLDSFNSSHYFCFEPVR